MSMQRLAAGNIAGRTDRSLIIFLKQLNVIVLQNPLSRDSCLCEQSLWMRL